MIKYFKEIADVLAFVNRQMILIFKTNDLLRGEIFLSSIIFKIKISQGLNHHLAPRTVCPPSSRCLEPASELSRRNSSYHPHPPSQGSTSRWWVDGLNSKYPATKYSSTSTGPGSGLRIKVTLNDLTCLFRVGGILRLRWDALMTRINYLVRIENLVLNNFRYVYTECSCFRLRVYFNI